MSDTLESKGLFEVLVEKMLADGTKGMVVGFIEQVGEGYAVDIHAFSPDEASEFEMEFADALADFWHDAQKQWFKERGFSPGFPDDKGTVWQ